MLRPHIAWNILILNMNSRLILNPNLTEHCAFLIAKSGKPTLYKNTTNPQNISYGTVTKMKDKSSTTTLPLFFWGDLH